jgi:hypothetical protein
MECGKSYHDSLSWASTWSQLNCQASRGCSTDMTWHDNLIPLRHGPTDYPRDVMSHHRRGAGVRASEPQWPPRTPKPQLANIAKPTLHRRTGHCMTLLGLVKNCYNPKISQTSETCTKVFNLVFQIILGKKVLKQCSSTLNLSMVQCFSESTQLSIQMVLIQDTRMESANPVHRTKIVEIIKTSFDCVDYDKAYPHVQNCPKSRDPSKALPNHSNHSHSFQICSTFQCNICNICNHENCWKLLSGILLGAVVTATVVFLSLGFSLSGPQWPSGCCQGYRNSMCPSNLLVPDTPAAHINDAGQSQLKTCWWYQHISTCFANLVSICSSKVTNFGEC